MAALNGGGAILTIGLFAWLTDLPLVFPALGPSTFILFTMPLTRGGAPRSVILGHWICLGCGYAVWRLMGVLTGEVVSIETGGWPLFAGPTVALGLSCLFLVRFSCPHPPACASSLVVALGAVTQVHELLLMAAVVVWLTYQAVGMNRFAGLPVPLWSPRSHVE
ncbi:MAG: hypothetical protein AMJ79_11575 [Phycisphaerae bacterium SM23_30]|nr:MAG: hypothetical protein AMJ79_11575 [Phycisphaerae bacterium SM23_30]